MTWTIESGKDTPPPGTAQLGEVRQWIDRHALEGLDCPACTRRVRHEAYALRRSWVNVLKTMARQQTEWVRLADAEIFGGSGDTAPALRHWGLIDRMPGHREDGYPSTGYYRITSLGWTFLHGTASVPRRIITFEANFLRFEDESDRVWVHDPRLGGPFDFSAHMRGEG